MSVKVNYKGEEILSVNTDITKTLKTSGKYCEGDIEVINTQDGGITPSGNIDITSMAQVDVTNYATAQVVDADLVASNIKKDVNILGVVGSFEGGGGDVIETDWLKAKKTTVIVGENSVTNYTELSTYLESLATDTDKIIGFSIRQKANYNYNEFGVANTVRNIGYRYRNEFVRYVGLSSAFDAVATVGDEYDVFTISEPILPQGVE